MQAVKPTWKSGAVLVCGHERPPGAEKPSCGAERGAALRDALKERIRAEGLRGEIHAARTTCLGICSAQGLTVDLIGVHGQRQTLLVDPSSEIDVLWEEVKRTLLAGER
jgi:hypothetical protein